jgi:hypothetical protein
MQQMSAEEEHGPSTTPASDAGDDIAGETLTDFIDRVDREAFRRALEHRSPYRTAYRSAEAAETRR